MPPLTRKHQRTKEIQENKNWIKITLQNKHHLKNEHVFRIALLVLLFEFI